MVVLAGLALWLLRPGVAENGVRSPRAWLAVVAVLLLARLVRALSLRLGGRRRLGSALSGAVVATAAVALLLPSFQQRTLDEPFPAALAEAAAQAPVAGATAQSPLATGQAPTGQADPPAAAPRELSRAPLEGVRHRASGRTAFSAVDGGAVLRFEDVDIEGTSGPVVYLVPRGQRTPNGSVELGALRAERGSFGYPLPAGVDPGAGWTVLVWCARYDTPIAVADH